MTSVNAKFTRVKMVLRRILSAYAMLRCRMRMKAGSTVEMERGWGVLDVADIEGDAMALYRMVGLDPYDPVDLRTLVVRMIGSAPSPATIMGEAELLLLGDKYRIFFNRRLSPARARWRVGHELAHVFYAKQGFEGDDIEAKCDALGAVLVAPRKVVQAARRAVGDNPKRIASVLQVTQALALLRLAECQLVDGGAVATPTRTLARGEIEWPDEESLRRVIRRRGPGLANVRHVKITDQRATGGLLVVA